MSNPLRIGLRTKLVLLVVVSITVASIIIGSFRLTSEKERITDAINHAGTARASLIAETIAHLIIGYDYGNMESLADRIVLQDDIHQIIIRNRDEKIMVSRSNQKNPDNRHSMRIYAPVIYLNEEIGSVELLISLRELDHAISTIFHNIILELLFSGFLLGGVIYLGASWLIIKPISGFRKLMHDIIANPNADIPPNLDIETKDEIGALASMFNNMAQQINDVQQRLHQKIDLADSALIATNDQLRGRTAELEKALIQVEKLATTDSLTSLPNRRHFDDQINNSFARAQRHDEPLSLILLDIDFFKQINDTYGHAAGDWVLQELAGLIKLRIRDTDILARLGGDEFALLLERTTATDAKMLSDLILTKIQTHEFIHDGECINVSISMGIAQITHNTRGIESFCSAADKALYEAKRCGRNQATVYPFTRNQQALPS